MELQPITKISHIPTMQIKRQLGVLEGVAIILSIILGSGIFISPSGVLQEAGSIGLSLLIWILCGGLAMIGAICYSELGTSIPKSGGDYTYIHDCFGPLCSFMYLWDAVFIFIPTTSAVMGLTFAEYIVQPFFPNCLMPPIAIKLLATAVISLITVVNCCSVKWVTKFQKVFMCVKIVALSLVIFIGICYGYVSSWENLNDMWKETQVNPGNIAVAFYTGSFSYAGWNCLNFMTEELKNPNVNLPRSIYISMPIVTIIYVFANISYAAVLMKEEMISTDAIAITFGNKILGPLKWVTPFVVATSAMGALATHTMTSSRMCFVGARHGHIPSILSFISHNTCLPTPSLIFLAVVSVLMLFTCDIYSLITYCTFAQTIFMILSISGIFCLRLKKRTTHHQPIKIPIILPLIFILVNASLLVLPCYVRPMQVVMGIVVTLSSIPVYYFFIIRDVSLTICIPLKKINIFIQKLLLVAAEDEVSNATHFH